MDEELEINISMAIYTQRKSQSNVIKNLIFFFSNHFQNFYIFFSFLKKKN